MPGTRDTSKTYAEMTLGERIVREAERRARYTVAAKRRRAEERRAREAAEAAEVGGALIAGLQRRIKAIQRDWPGSPVLAALRTRLRRAEREAYWRNRETAGPVSKSPPPSDETGTTS